VKRPRPRRTRTYGIHVMNPAVGDDLRRDRRGRSVSPFHHVPCETDTAGSPLRALTQRRPRGRRSVESPSHGNVLMYMLADLGGQEW
jgi:hypothetical protein